jgi:hypothetical protein
VKLEYLRQTDTKDPRRSIVRLYDFKPGELQALIEIFRRLSKRRKTEVRLERKSFTEPIEGCRLLLKRGDSDRGISDLGGNYLECELKGESWETAALRAESLVAAACGSFQWLCDLAAPIEFLLSRDGRW